MAPGSLLNRSTRRLFESARSQHEVRSKVQARLILRLIIFLSLFSFAAGAVPPVPRSRLQSQAAELKSGEPISTQIRGGERAAFSVSIPHNQYFRILVDQEGVVLTVELFAGDGKSIVRLENVSGAYGPLYVSYVSKSPERYKLE